MNGHAIGLGKEVSRGLVLARFYHLVLLNNAAMKNSKTLTATKT